MTVYETLCNFALTMGKPTLRNFKSQAHSLSYYCMWFQYFSLLVGISHSEAENLIQEVLRIGPDPIGVLGQPSPVNLEYTAEQCLSSSSLRETLNKDLKNGLKSDETLPTDEILRRNGYIVETHKVTTKDLYILTVFRIIGGKLSPPRKGKEAAFLNHGSSGSSGIWVSQIGNNSLAMKLADEGFDVWLGNCRGSRYSMDHVNLDSGPLGFQYWNFSFHEMGVYDLPAVINKILTTTGHEKIFYIGFSLGTTSYFVLLSELTEYNDKIKLGIMLAPSVFWTHGHYPLHYGALLFNTGRLPSTSVDMDLLVHKLGLSTANACHLTAVRCGVCNVPVFYLFGYDPGQLNHTEMSTVYSKSMDQYSTKAYFHLYQNYIRKDFRHFDENAYPYPLDKTGPVHDAIKISENGKLPKSYNLRGITTPTVLFAGRADNTGANPIDIEKLRRAMKNDTIKDLIWVDWPYFNHIDFYLARDLDKLVHKRVVEILKNESYVNT